MELHRTTGDRAILSSWETDSRTGSVKRKSTDKMEQ